MLSARLRSYAAHEMLTRITVCVLLCFLACTVKGTYSFHPFFVVFVETFWNNYSGYHDINFVVLLNFELIVKFSFRFLMPLPVQTKIVSSGFF